MFFQKNRRDLDRMDRMDRIAVYIDRNAAIRRAWLSEKVGLAYPCSKEESWQRRR